MVSGPGHVGAQIRLGDADCPADMGGEQLARLDEPADGLGADAEMLGDC